MMAFLKSFYREIKTARQMIHMKCQTLFSLKKQKIKKNKKSKCCLLTCIIVSLEYLKVFHSVCLQSFMQKERLCRHIPAIHI